MPPPRALVMVIDDDHAFMTLIEDFLEDEGYDVVGIDDAGNAFEMVRQTVPAAVILDVRMQEPESGKRILEQIRGDPVTRDVSIIISTADEFFLLNNADFLRAQDVLVLPKPFDLDDLLTLVDRAINSRSAEGMPRDDGDGMCS